MGISFVLDIVLGLIFIYLTLSLLASEIQELIVTLLQWRATHLKKSIEVLIGGDAEKLADPDPAKLQQIRDLANQIYGNPLIKDLNQSATGAAARWFRSLGGALFDFIRQSAVGRDFFGKGQSSGPSYIPPKTFAKSLLETLKVPDVSHAIARNRFEKFKRAHLRDLIALMQENNPYFSASSQEAVKKHLRLLAKSYDEIFIDFSNKIASLDFSLDRMELKLDEHIKVCGMYLPEEERGTYFYLSRLQALKENRFGEVEKEVLLREMKPTVRETIEIARKSPAIYREFEEAMQLEDGTVKQEIVQLFDSLPDSLKDSMAMLSRQVQQNTKSLEEDLQNLQDEVENWFDRSMARAQGVYSRNARGIAIVIGLIVAVAANVDTLHLVDRLSKDPILRSTIAESAKEQVERESTDPNIEMEELRASNREIRQALEEDVPLPIGWTPSNLAQQREEEWGIPWLKRIFGWIISGVAISMGASFWFELLSKVVKVQNIGNTDHKDSTERRSQESESQTGSKGYKSKDRSYG